MKTNSYINSLLLSVSIAISLFILLSKAVSHYKHNHLYNPISKPQLPSYGTVDITSDSSSSNTMVTQQDFDMRYQPWSVYNCVRLLLSAFQLALIAYGTWSLTHDALQDIDKEVEGNYTDILRMYYTRIAFWVRSEIYNI